MSTRREILDSSQALVLGQTLTDLMRSVRSPEGVELLESLMSELLVLEEELPEEVCPQNPSKHHSAKAQLIEFENLKKRIASTQKVIENLESKIGQMRLADPALIEVLRSTKEKQNRRIGELAKREEALSLA